MLDGKKNILWDFDGVIMDSMPVRNRGFEIVLQKYPEEQVSKLMEYHLKNGGLSRYVKFRYFFEEIRNEEISEEQVNKWAKKFSEVMRMELLNDNLFIVETLNFIQKYNSHFNMHIVSGSDQAELRYICENLNIAHNFLSIYGSPTPKKQLVSDLLKEYGYDQKATILIGDSINDYEAAKNSNIHFAGFNNPQLKGISDFYIDSFESLYVE